MQKVIHDKSMWLSGVVGLFPANRAANGEDVEVYADETRSEPTATFCMLHPGLACGHCSVRPICLRVQCFTIIQ